jgi:uncharacterized protein YjbI with pentapeptide repeats
MRIHKPDTAEVVLRSYVDLAGRRILSVGIVHAFDLHPDAALAARDSSVVWPLVTAAIGDLAPLDEGWAKMKSEFFVYGSAYMPKSGAQQPISAKASLGHVQKQLAVYGDRSWTPMGTIGKPDPFWRIPLIPERAFGGKNDSMNLLRNDAVDSQIKTNGMAMDFIPNIEHPGQLIQNRSDHPSPAGFWALNSEDPRRMQHFGTVNEKWLKTRWPHFPLDTHPDYLQAAPYDQQSISYWQGNEAFALVNLHPVYPLIEGVLPGLTARILIATQDSDKVLSIVESRSLPETVWFFPDHLKGLILHRAVFEVKAIDGDDVNDLYVEFENKSNKPATFEILKSRILSAMAAADIPDQDEYWSPVDSSASNQDSMPSNASPDINEAMHKLESLEQWVQTPASQELSIQKSTSMIPMTPLLDPQTAAELASIKTMIEQSKQTVAAAFKNTNMTEKDLLEILFNQPDAPGMPNIFSDSPNSITQVLDELQADVEKLYLSDAEMDQAALEGDAGAVRSSESAEEVASPADTQLRQTVMDMHAQGESFEGMDLSGTDLSGLDLSGADFSGVSLSEANFTQAQLERCKFDGAILSSAVFAGAMLRNASLKDVSAGQANFQQANLDSAVLFESDFSGADFSKATLISATLRQSVFSGAHMADINASDAIADEAIFDEANLEGANFSGARLKSTHFTNASMPEVNLSRCIAPRLDVSGANLSSANLSSAYLDSSIASKSTDLSKAMLRESVLTNCNWHGVNLEGADLNEASMDKADLMGANLRHVSMLRSVARGACLDKADLTGLDATGANLFEGGFRGTTLSSSSFNSANLFAADFSDAKIDSVHLEGANIERTIIKLRNTLA